MRNRVFLLTLALACLAPAVSAQAPEAQSRSSATTLKPGDIVRLRIWREPDMSGEFTVDEAGMVVFPRVGEYRVLDDTPESLSARLQADYRQYLVNPSIEVTVLRRVRIVGAVNNPGLFPVDPTVTVGDALALAGGPTLNGDPDKVRIIRNGQEIAVNIRANTRLTDSAIQSGDQLYVPERSWISRNSNVVATSIAASVSLIIALFIR
ncbi:MAG TPA: polysaccharide biosynthesis/export family protein [Longimicrobiales bacterium]|nr:polysaccharide biosynthesis/export family protein [Longimicrobiales bacterium]